MRPLALGSDANIVYIFNQGSQTVNGGFGELKRDDVRTGSKTVIVHLANELIDAAQVSNDGQWILFLTHTGNYFAIQMIRMDGQGLQTLYCTSGSIAYPQASRDASLQWSPDHSMIAFSVQTQSISPLETVYVLNLATGQVIPEIVQPNTTSTGYVPLTWVDNTRVYLQGVYSSTPQCGIPCPSYTDSLYLLDTTKGPDQTPADLQQVISPSLHAYWSIDSDYNTTKLVVGQSAPVNPHPLGLYDGPSSISVTSIIGGSPHTIYSSTHAVIQVRLLGYSSNTLLFVIDSDGFSGVNVDTSQNGLWKINTNGAGLTRLTANTSQNTLIRLNGFSQYPWSNISLDGSMYVFEVDSPTLSPAGGLSYTLYYGSLNGGAPVEFAFGVQGDINFVMMAGWTKM
ncbi:MAG: hypothetical protein NVS3B14_15790 [Ktedonobacteraceae bacterium]